jgi:16S rRNA (adenine1518-N6/adenine1519-N6)-dimethyltransferase
LSIAAIRELLERHGLRPNRELGQNFLVEPAQARRLVELAGVESGDAVIEVGTGLGVLTRALAARAARVVSIEVDAGLVRALRAERMVAPNVELIHANALDLDLQSLVQAQRGSGAAVRVVANLPYSAATPMLRRLLDLRGLLADWSVMVQREVGERLLASCGARDYGSLAVLHQLCVTARRELDLRPRCFYPAPGVDSSFIRVSPLRQPLLAPGELAAVERVLRGVFSQRRKTIANALRLAGYGGAVEAGLEAVGIEPRARAETVPPRTLLKLARLALAGFSDTLPDGP